MTDRRSQASIGQRPRSTTALARPPLRRLTLALCLGSAFAATSACAQPSATPATSASAMVDCTQGADRACLHRLSLPNGAGDLAYYASRPLAGAATPVPDTALVVVHGYSRNAAGAFRAGLRAAERAQRLGRTLVVAPVFQVVPQQAARCHSQGTPPAQMGMRCGPAAAGRRAICRAAAASRSARSRRWTR